MFVGLVLPAALRAGVDAGGYFTITMPQGEFDEKVEKNGYGLTGQALFSAPGLPTGSRSSTDRATMGSFGRVPRASTVMP